MMDIQRGRRQICGSTLYARRDTTIGSVCAHLRHSGVSEILVKGSEGKLVGYVPLSHLMQLTARDPAYCTYLLNRLTLEEIKEALQGEIAYRSQEQMQCWERFVIVQERLEDVPVHRGFVIAQGERALLLSLLDLDASCLVIAAAPFLSRSLLRRAREREMTLIYTGMNAIQAAHSLLMAVPLDALMERMNH